MFERLKSLISGANIAGATVTPKKTKSVDVVAKEVLQGKWGSGETRKKKLTAAGYNYNAVQKKVNELIIDRVAREVLKGKWGAGDTRKNKLTKAGYNYKAVQNRVNEILKEQKKTTPKTTPTIQDNICAWAKQIANSKQYHYKVFTDDVKTHQCPICNKLTGEYKGWNCIGFAWAAWHHGGGIPCKCNCEVINDTTGNKLLKLSDKEALNLVQQKSGIKEVQVIRNGGKALPTSMLKAGDIILYFEGNTYTHMLLYVGNGKIADCGRGQKPEIQYGNNYAQKYCKVAIRYTGKSAAAKTTTTKTTTTKTTTTSTITKKSYTGQIPTLHLVKTNAEVIQDAIKWAKWIASDNRFHYGYGKHAHHNGCYFCGTQKLKMNHGIVDPQFTYCCNPFVGAAWAHGGCVPAAQKLCQNTNSWDFGTGNGSYEKSSLFTKLGKPDYSKLKPGDVLCGDSHVALYIGNGKVIQASGGDDNVRNSKKWNNSISIGTWNGWKRAYRFNGSVNADIVMRHGEVSKRVEQWQKFLDWCYDGAFFKECGGADGCFGDNTLKWTKKFQEQYIGKGQGDGLCENKTFEAAKKVKK